MLRHGLLIFAVIISGCQPYSIDATGDGENPTIVRDVLGDLRSCADDLDCETRSEAQFKLAMIDLGKVERRQCVWAQSDGGRLVTQRLRMGAKREASIQTLSLDEWVARGPEQAQAEMQTAPKFSPYEFECDYNEDSADFKKAYKLLESSTSQGHHDAANKLAMLHMNDPDLFDLDYARSILAPCHAKGGGFCAFNLARIESLTSEDGCGRCLGLMRIADRRTGDKQIRFTYALAKKKLGRGEITGRVFFDLEADKGTQAYLSEFDDLFPRLASRKP